MSYSAILTSSPRFFSDLHDENKDRNFALAMANEQEGDIDDRHMDSPLSIELSREKAKRSDIQEIWLESKDEIEGEVRWHVLLLYLHFKVLHYTPLLFTATEKDEKEKGILHDRKSTGEDIEDTHVEFSPNRACDRGERALLYSPISYSIHF